MRFQSALFSLLLLILPTTAIVPPRYEALLYAIQKRACAVPCGYNNAYCCGSNSICYTDAQTIAQCAASTAYASITALGGAQVYTTVYTDTELVTRTSVYTVWNGATAVATSYLAQSTAVCGAGTQACGAICCGPGYVCWASGNCRASAGLGGATTTVTSAGYSAPVRPTSQTTTTTVVGVTTTRGFQTPVGTAGGTYGITANSSSGGLSGGAIAGIVIGSIAGVILLIAICFCCCLRAGFHGLLAIFGLGSKKDRPRERTEVVEERYTRYGSRPGGAAAAGRQREDYRKGWFGGENRPVRVEEKRTSNETKALAGMGLGLAGLAAALGLRRNEAKKEQRRRPARSEASYSSYTDSYTGTSASSESSDPRRSRVSRQPPPPRR